MSSTSTAGMSSMARDTMKDARDAVKESVKAASAAGTDMKSDLDALRGDVAKLTQQIADILGSKGSAAWDRAKSNVEGVIADVELLALQPDVDLADLIVDRSRAVGRPEPDVDVRIAVLLHGRVTPFVAAPAEQQGDEREPGVHGRSTPPFDAVFASRAVSFWNFVRSGPSM